MDRATQLALNEINRRFYRDAAGSFSATRSDPWDGWRRLLAACTSQPPVPELWNVLDVACGNGRLGVFLASELPGPVSYLGLDASQPLLDVAASRLEPLAQERGWTRCALRRHDLVTEPLAPQLAGERWHLIAVFGLLHHLPGAALRQRLLVELAGALAPGGWLALSLWRFDRDPRFRRRVLPWSELPRTADPALDLAQLEPGDLLLRWGNAGGQYRYCHLADDAEEARLLAALPLTLVDRYDTDGRTGGLNRYLLLRAGATATG